MHHIHTETTGDTGPLVVFSHGWGDTGATWSHQVACSPTVPGSSRGICSATGRATNPDDPDVYSHERASPTSTRWWATTRLSSSASFGGACRSRSRSGTPSVLALGLFSTGPGYRDAEGRDAWNTRIETQAQACEGRDERAAAQLDCGSSPNTTRRSWTVSRRSRCPRSCSSAPRTCFLNAADYFEEKIPNATKVLSPTWATPCTGTSPRR